MSNGAGDWGYSTDAVNVLDKFYGADAVVLVEGEDDQVFWSTLFEKSGMTHCYVDFVGGIQELVKVMRQIIDEDARVIVACDSCYSVVLGNLPRHARIVRTYGHSIENTMYCPRTIDQAIRKLSRNLEDRTASIDKWLGEFCDTCKVLVVYDVANEKYQRGVKVFTDKCSKFLRSPYSAKLNEDKISDYVNKIKRHFQQHELAVCKKLIDNCDRQMRHMVKGHFLTNGVINFIKNTTHKHTGNRPAISLDNLYALTCDGCKACTVNCHEFGLTRKEIEKAYNSLKLL